MASLIQNVSTIAKKNITLKIIVQLVRKSLRIRRLLKKLIRLDKILIEQKKLLLLNQQMQKTQILNITLQISFL